MSENQEQTPENPIELRKRQIAEAQEKKAAELASLGAEAAELEAQEAAATEAAKTESLLTEREATLVSSKENNAEINSIESEGEKLQAEYAEASEQVTLGEQAVIKAEADFKEYEETLEDARAAGVPDDPQYTERMNEANQKVEASRESLAAMEAKAEELNEKLKVSEAGRAEADARIEEITPGRVEDIKTPEQRAAVDALHNEALTEDQERSSLEGIYQKFNKDEEFRLNNPESLVNKLVSADKTSLSRLQRYMKSGLDRDTQQELYKLHIDYVEFDKRLPELLEKGLVDESSYANYLFQEAYRGGNGNSVDMLRMDELLSDMPIETINKLADSLRQLDDPINDWFKSRLERIDIRLKEKTKLNDGREVVKDPADLLTTVSNVIRFNNDDPELKLALKEAIDSFRISPTGSVLKRSPVIENLFQAGFSEEASELVKMGVDKGFISNSSVLEYNKKGYLADDQARKLLRI